MAEFDKKITELTAAATLTPTSLLVTVDDSDGLTKRAPLSILDSILNFLRASDKAELENGIATQAANILAARNNGGVLATGVSFNTVSNIISATVPADFSLAKGARLRFFSLIEPTGAVSISLNGAAAIAVWNPDGSPAGPLDFPARSVIELVKDDLNRWRIAGTALTGSMVKRELATVGIVDATVTSWDGVALAVTLPVGYETVQYVSIAVQLTSPYIGPGPMTISVNGAPVRTVYRNDGNLLRPYDIGSTAGVLDNGPVNLKRVGNKWFLDSPTLLPGQLAEYMRDNAILRTKNVSGSDLIHIEMHDDQYGIVPVPGTIMQIKMAETNIMPNPRITIAGLTMYVKGFDGFNVGAGALRAGVTYTMKMRTGSIIDMLDNPTDKPVAFAIQTGSNLPDRPNAQVVFWQTWLDPSSLMGPIDLEFRLPMPTVPGFLPEPKWRFWDRRNGGGVAVKLIGNPPEQNPPLTRAEITIDGVVHNMTDLTQPLFLAGYTLGNDYSAHINLVNFVGRGLSSPAQTVTITTGNMVDEFAGTELDDESWLRLDPSDSYNEFSVSGGLLRVAATGNRQHQLLSNTYYEDDQFAEMSVLSVTNNFASDRGVALMCRTQANGDGYALYLWQSGWMLATCEGRWGSGLTNDRYTELDSGVIASLPVTVRLECEGTTIRAFVNSVEVASVTDTMFSSGEIHIRSFNTDGSTETQIGRFEGGNL